jgi:hypothetical protein
MRIMKPPILHKEKADDTLFIENHKRIKRMKRVGSQKNSRI